MGVPTYGRCFTLDLETETGIYAPSSMAGRPGPYTEESGILGYNEVSETVNAKRLIISSLILNQG